MSFAFPRAVLAFASAPLLFAAAGCSSGPVASSYMAQADVTNSISAVAATRPVRGSDPSLALAQMPEPGGSVVGMRERLYANGVKQEIVLAGDKSGFGDNMLTVAMQAAPAAAGARDQVPMSPPSEAGIKNEIIARYPKVDMQILTQPRRNVLGPFGLAIGRHASGARCVFAWQWVDDVRNPGVSSSSLGKLGSFGASGQSASIRVHMCRKDATVDDLAMAVEGLTLAPQSVLDRALDGSRAASSVVATRPAGGGMIGGATGMSDGTLESALTTAVRPQRQTASEPAPERQRVARRARKKPDVAVADESVAPQQSPVAPVYTSGPRYLAAVPGAPMQAPYAASPAATAYNAPSYGSVPGYGGAGAPPSKTLDPSLPAAAYRGPGGQR